MRGPFIDPPIADLAFCYKVGAPVSLLARVYDVSESTVRNRLKAAGVKMRRCGAPAGNQYARKERSC
jgi:hypothetical protein